MNGACKDCGCAYHECECRVPDQTPEPTQAEVGAAVRVLSTTVSPPEDLHWRVLLPHIHDLLPNAVFAYDNDGQIVIYTGYREHEDSLVPVKEDP